jgi:hypothetical protein
VQIASKHNILPQNLQNWKKTFLANAEIAMEPSKAVKEYKEELVKSQKQNEICTRVLSFCNNSSTNFVLNVEVYLVRFLLIFLL